MNFVIDENFNNFVDNYANLLNEFGKIHNLSNYKNLNNVALDSIKSLEILDFMPKICFDIGSGGGIPAIFLAKILSDCEFHLFEPNNKKSSFLTYAKLNLSLQNITIHKERIENFTGLYPDLITSRAVVKTKDFINLCQKILTKDTKILLFKGSDYKEELKNLKYDYKILNDKNRNYILIQGF